MEKIKVHYFYKKNLFCFRQLIYNYPEQLFADAGVMAIEHADFDGIERLALVTGGEIVSTFDQPGLVKLGTCKLIEQVQNIFLFLSNKGKPLDGLPGLIILTYVVYDIELYDHLLPFFTDQWKISSIAVVE